MRGSRREKSTSARVMAPTRMKLRVRRHDGTAGGSEPAEEEARSRESGSGRSTRRKNANNVASTSTSAAAADTASPPSTSATSTSTRAMVAAEDASPDSKCPICLDRFNNLAYLDRCLHRFCFPCIQEWSHNKAECPLCKQPFTSILHSVRAEDDFKEYTLRPPPANSSVAATVAMVAAMVSAARNDPRMLRLMLRRNRTMNRRVRFPRRTRRERGGRGGRGAGVWEMYFDSPSLPIASLSPNPAAADDRDEGEELGQQAIGGRPDPGRGVIFDGLTGLRMARTRDRTYRRLMTRLVARRRQQQGGGTVRQLRERETVAFRRGLYRCGIRVHGVAGVNDNQAQQWDVSAESFRHDPVHLNKLRPWLQRELTVLYGAHNSLVDIVQRIIMAQLARHGLEDTPTIEDELRPFLLARTDHFLHELVSFARSPLTLENYDLQAVYEPPAAAMELEGMSSPSDSSSVIAISEGEEEEGPVGGRSEEGRAASAHDDVIQTGSCLSLSVWDDETPGPSYSTAEPLHSLTPPTSNSAHQEVANEERERQEEEECLIVGYKKPMAERTPELVQLSSDTEEDDNKAKKEEPTEKAPPLPSSISPPPLSYVPTIPPSTSSAFLEEPDETLKEKSDEAAACRSRGRSWSASSGRSRGSVSSLSPSERHQDWTRSGSENRRRRKRRKTQDKSGTLYNPNRSIYPAMMCRHPHTPSPLHSSTESASPLPPSPLDSSWDFNCSSLTSSPSHSSSPLCLSPLLSSPQTPPTLSPGDTHNREKPGGKRKYKSRHLDSNDKDPTWRPSGSHQEKRRGSESRRRKTRVRDGRRRRRRRESGGYRGDSSRKCRDDRCPSVEIVYEGTCDAAQPPPRKRHRKFHRNSQHNSSPVIITLDSDSSRDAVNSSSSPLSSQQTVDFSDLPPLPLAHSAGMGGVMDEEMSELPVNILDRESDGSDVEPLGRRETGEPIDIGSNSDNDIDVENDEETPSSGVHGPIRNKSDDRESTEKKGGNDSSNVEKSEASPSDSRLLASILEDLQGIVAPKCDRSLNFGSSRSPDTRKQSLRNCSKPDMSKDSKLRSVKDQDRDSEWPTFSSSAPSLSPPRQIQCMDIPPLLKRASPVQSHNRNTPPPLKHKDAGSPHLSPVSPLFSDADPVSEISSRGSNPSPAHTGIHLPQHDDAIHPGLTLKDHFTSSLALRGASTAPSPLTTFVTHNSKPSVDPRSTFGSGCSSGSADNPLLLPFTFYPSSLHSGCDGWPSPRRKFPLVHSVNSVSPVDFHSMEPGRSKPALTDSTPVGHRKKIGLNSSRVPPDDFHVSGSKGAGDVFSGIASDNASSTLLASTIEARTWNSPSPVDSHSSITGDNLSQRSKSPKPTVDLHSSQGLKDSRTSTVNHEGHLPPTHLKSSPSAQATLNSSVSTTQTEGHLNHTALPSSTSDAVNTEDNSQLERIVESEPHNHFDTTSDSRIPIETASKQNLPLIQKLSPRL